MTSACSNGHLVFATYTKTGLDITLTEGAPTQLVFGYKRFEGAIVPMDPNIKDVLEELSALEAKRIRSPAESARFVLLKDLAHQLIERSLDYEGAVADVVVGQRKSEKAESERDSSLASVSTLPEFDKDIEPAKAVRAVRVVYFDKAAALRTKLKPLLEDIEKKALAKEAGEVYLRQAKVARAKIVNAPDSSSSTYDDRVRSALADRKEREDELADLESVLRKAEQAAEPMKKEEDVLNKVVVTCDDYESSAQLFVSLAPELKSLNSKRDSLEIEFQRIRAKATETSLYASNRVESGWVDGLKICQVFATGKAAELMLQSSERPADQVVDCEEK